MAKSHQGALELSRSNPHCADGKLSLREETEATGIDEVEDARMLVFPSSLILRFPETRLCEQWWKPHGLAPHPGVVGAVEKRRHGLKKESVLVRGQEILGLLRPHLE